jgi:hypothetical protein
LLRKDDLSSDPIGMFSLFDNPIRKEVRRKEGQKDRKTYIQQSNKQTERQINLHQNQVTKEFIFYQQFLQKDDLFSDRKESNWNVRRLL